MIWRTSGQQSTFIIWRWGVCCASRKAEENIIWKYSERMSMARWAGKSVDFWAEWVLGGKWSNWEVGPTGMPFAFSSLVEGSSFVSLGKVPLASSSKSSSAFNKTSAKIAFSLSHLMSTALTASITILCLTTFSLNQASS